MEMYGNILCVSFAELVGGGIISKPTYDKYVREGKLTVVQKGGNGRKALVAYSSMIEKVRAAYDEVYKGVKEAMKKQEEEMYISTQIKFDAEAVDFYKKYVAPNGGKISTERQLEYILNAQVMNEMVRIEKKRNADHAKSGHTRRPETWSSVLKTCERLRERCNHTLPTNPGRLREKFNAYKKYGYVALINGNVGNKAAQKISKAEGRLLLKLKRSKFPVYTDMQIFEEYNREAPLRGLKTIKSPTTVHNYLYSPEVMIWWYAAVYGEREFKNKYMPTFDTILPAMPNALWYSDGTRLNLYYKVYDEKQKRMVARATDVYEVMDACSEALLGYYIGDGENFLSQYNAYRSAIRQWKVKPYEIVTDNQGGHKKLASQGFFKKICHLHKTTMPHNGQSKTIEAAFGRFQSQVLHKLYNFTGQNVTAKKLNSKPNMELITKNIDKLPTLEELKEIYAGCREKWNHSVHPTSETGMLRIEMQTAIENPKAQSIDDYEAQEIFMIYSLMPVIYQKEGYVFSIKNQEYRYMVYDDEGNIDMNFHLLNLGNKFHYRYDPEDMTRIELWQVTETGLKYAATATPKVAIHRATQERTEEENAILFSQLDANKRTKAAQYIAAEDLFVEVCKTEGYYQLNIPLPVGISKKEMEHYREEMKAGRLKAPVPIPEKVEIPEPALIDVEALGGIVSDGDYTKQLSRITFDELERLEEF
ncbi:MAG: hypothetical protein LUI85_19150 [Bacteroides sp.]|nr:hypothetical protein [Bacteroides sp.]